MKWKDLDFIEKGFAVLMLLVAILLIVIIVGVATEGFFMEYQCNVQSGVTICQYQ